MSHLVRLPAAGSGRRGTLNCSSRSVFPPLGRVGGGTLKREADLDLTLCGEEFGCGFATIHSSSQKNENGTMISLIVSSRNDGRPCLDEFCKSWKV